MNGLRVLRGKVLPLGSFAKSSGVVRFSTGTRCLSMPMKPGSPIPGLDIFKDKDSPVALERSEYPEWVNTLTEPMVSLAKLRKMTVEEATDKEMKRYLKLVRRARIKESNEEAKAQ